MLCEGRFEGVGVNIVSGARCGGEDRCDKMWWGGRLCCEGLGQVAHGGVNIKVVLEKLKRDVVALWLAKRRWGDLRHV